MVGKLRKRIGDKERVGERSCAGRNNREPGRLKNDRVNREEFRVRGEGNYDGAKLGGEQEPSNSAVGKEEVATSASSGSGLASRVIKEKDSK
jgi:hypothetical protein